jgi:hypothetical protein
MRWAQNVELIGKMINAFNISDGSLQEQRTDWRLRNRSDGIIGSKITIRVIGCEDVTCSVGLTISSVRYRISVAL